MDKGIRILLKLVFVCGLGFSSPSIGQELSGQIVEKSTGMKIPGAAIFIPELNRGIVTDMDGEFTIPSLPGGALTFQISFVGFETIIMKIDPSSIPGPIYFQMEVATSALDEVVVSGAYIMSRENSPINIEKVSREQVLKMPSPSLMSSLSRVPGVNQVSLGPGISKPVIRGLSFSRVLSVYQGARFENQQWGADHGLGLNETGISGVEIIKGPASIIYGSGAMAGVIHLVEDSEASMGEIEGDINLRAYTNTLGVRGEAGVKGALQNGMTWNLRGAMESHGDYRTGGGGVVGNSRFGAQNIKGGLGLQKKWGGTKIRYSYLSQDLGLIDEVDPASLVTSRNDRFLQLPFQQIQDHFLNSETNVFLGDDKVKLTVGYHWNIREEIESAKDEVDLGLQQGNFIYDLKYYKSLSPDLELISGIQGFYLRNKNNEDSNDILIPDATKDDRSLYGLINLTKPKWIVQGGLRYDYRKVVADAGKEHLISYGFVLPGDPLDRQLSQTFDGITASGGATFKPDDNWRIRFNVASGFRAPDLAELFSNGPHPGTSRFEAGDVSFQREQNIQGDLGIRYRNADFSLSVEGFYNRVANYIYIGPTSEMKGGLTVWRYEQGDARLYGGESLLEIHPRTLKWLSGSMAYSVVLGQRDSDNSFLPYVPPFRWDQGVNFEFKDIGNFQQPYLGINGTWFMDQDRVAPLEEFTPGYYLMGLSAGGSFAIGGRKIDTYLNIANLLDRSYLEHLSLYRPFGVRQMGRNVNLHLRFEF